VLSAQTELRVLFFGDSLTAGYGVAPEQAYPALIQAKIDQLGIQAKVVVGAVSGDTSAGGLRRIDWMLRQPIDILLLALGANDMIFLNESVFVGLFEKERVFFNICLAVEVCLRF